MPRSSSEPAAAAPALEWPGRETRCEAERWNDLRLEVLLPRSARRWSRTPQVRRREPSPARCRSVPFALAPIGRARLRNSMPWPTPTPGRMKSRPSTLACSRPAFWRMRTSGAPTKCSANVWTARASRARLWREASRWLGRRTGSAGSCMPKCSPSASTRTPGTQLEAALEKSGTADPVRPVALRNPDEQLSYCIKFVTYHQPGRRLVPLPPDRLVELAAWWSRYRFEDFLFAYGARRRGGRLVVDK